MILSIAHLAYLGYFFGYALKSTVELHFLSGCPSHPGLIFFLNKSLISLD